MSKGPRFTMLDGELGITQSDFARYKDQYDRDHPVLSRRQWDDIHTSLASARMWLVGEYMDRPREEFDRLNWQRNCDRALAALSLIEPPALSSMKGEEE